MTNHEMENMNSEKLTSIVKKQGERYDRIKEGIKSFIKEFSHESDRACVILCAAKMDYLLFQILEHFLLPNTNSQDELLDNDRALGTFSSRIHATYRLGLIDAEMTRALHLFRKLRNAFAHEISNSNFEQGPHKDRIRELVNPLSSYPHFERFKKNNFKDKIGVEADFCTIAAILVTRLESVLVNIKQIKPEETCTLIPPLWNSVKINKGD